MTPAPIREVVRLPRELAEKVAQWATVMNVPHAKMIEIALNHWEQQRPFDEAGTDAPNKAND